MKSRRHALQSLKPNPKRLTHPGLWLDRYIAEIPKPSKERHDQNEHGTPKDRLIREVLTLSEALKSHNEYENYYRRYLQALESWPAPVLTALGETQSRLVVGLGSSAVLENSITLHRTYGVPYIPGSALKGLASSYAAEYLADERWQRSFKDGETSRGLLQKLIFGDTRESGLVIFFDALPLPNEWELNRDITTVHHPGYYRGEGQPPADWDSPTPIPYLTAKGTFHFALGISPVAEESQENAQALIEIAAELLRRALQNAGVGAKTSVGYGRVSLKTFSPLEPPPPQRSEALERALQLAGFLQWNRDLPQRLVQIAQIWENLSPEEQKELEAFLKEEKGKLLSQYPHLKNARKQFPVLSALLETLGY